MKAEDFNKTINELQAEININNNQIDLSDERKRMANVNQFENKAIETFGFSILPYLGFVALFALLTKNGALSSITNTIPAESLPLIIVGSSLGIGTIGRKLLEWKFKTKERFKSFTTAKSQFEKLQEEVKYAVELEKAQNRNKAIEKTIDSLSSNQTILNSLSSRYDISDKNLPQTREESQQRVNELSTLLKEKYDELDILTTQKVLHERFWKVRLKSNKILDILIAGLSGGALTLIYGDMPLIILRDSLTYSSTSSSLIVVFAPLIMGFVGISGYMVNRNNNYKKTFNILNSKMDHNALPYEIKDAYEEQQDINAKEERIIGDISAILIQLQEQKRIMESFVNESEENGKKLETSVAEEYRITIGHSREYLNPSMHEDNNVKEGPANVEEGPANVEEGPALVFRRKPNNAQNPRK